MITLIDHVGTGTFFTLCAIYFTRYVGLAPAEFGLGLSIAGVAGLIAGIPMGYLADRLGTRSVSVWLLSSASTFGVLVLAVRTFEQYVLAASLLMLCDRGSRAVRNAQIAEVSSGPERAATRAYLRSIGNVGLSIGAGFGALALALGTQTAFVCVLALNALSYAAAAALMTRMPRSSMKSTLRPATPWLALRDAPFVSFTLVSSVLMLFYSVVEIAVPLWVVRHTDAPEALVSVLLVINTAAVIALQVMVSRRVTNVRAAVRATQLAGALLLVACAAFGVSDRADVKVTVTVLVLAACTLAAGELLQAAGSFTLAFDLAIDEAQGQYQGVYGMAFGLASSLGPVVMTSLPMALGVSGWLILGAIFASAAMLTAPVVRWVELTRPRYAEAAGSRPSP